MKIYYLLVICLLYCVLLKPIKCLKYDETSKPSVFDKIKASLQLASKLLGLDAASGVAELVSKTFGNLGKQSKNKNDKNESNIFAGFFRLLGLNSGKLGAIAVNGFIFLAQMISKSLQMKPSPNVDYARSFNPDYPLDWFFNNEKLSGLLQLAQNQELPGTIIEYIQEKSSDEETACIQLLICKSTPILWGMQKRLSTTVRDKTDDVWVSGSKSMFKFLPTMEEIADFGDTCEKKYPLCRIFD